MGGVRRNTRLKLARFPMFNPACPVSGQARIWRARLVSEAVIARTSYDQHISFAHNHFSTAGNAAGTKCSW
jgi:hypothetical protein